MLVKSFAEQPEICHFAEPVAQMHPHPPRHSTEQTHHASCATETLAQSRGCSPFALFPSFGCHNSSWDGVSGLERALRGRISSIGTAIGEDSSKSFARMRRGGRKAWRASRYSTKPGASHGRAWVPPWPKCAVATTSTRSIEPIQDAISQATNCRKQRQREIMTHRRRTPSAHMNNIPTRTIFAILPSPNHAKYDGSVVLSLDSLYALRSSASEPHGARTKIFRLRRPSPAPSCPASYPRGPVQRQR